MLININQNVFYLLFILAINFIIIISYSEEFPFYDDKQIEILYDSCKNKNPIFCSMFSAIEDIFTSLQNEKIESEESSYCDILCIQYNNVYARDIMCDDNIETKEFIDCDEDEDYLFEIKFNNCKVLIEGTISYRNSDISKIDFVTFLSELKFDSIIFRLDNEIENEIEVSYIENENKYNYNRIEAIFSSEIENITNKMDDIMNTIYDNYKSKISEKLDTNEQKEVFSNTIKVFRNKFSYFRGPRIMDENIKNITYIAFNDFEYDLSVNINSKIFFPWMNVSFEYALNHNISYHEGYFIIENFDFEEDSRKDNKYNGYGYNISYKYPQFSNDIDNNDIWKTIINEFKYNLNKYRTVDLF